MSPQRRKERKEKPFLSLLPRNGAVLCVLCALAVQSVGSCRGRPPADGEKPAAQRTSETATVRQPADDTASALASRQIGTTAREGALANFGIVSEELSRGAQPTREGFKRLREMGIKTVVNLRSAHSDRDEIRGLDFYYASIPCRAWDIEEADLLKFLRIVREPKYQPVFVHCQYGSDRTGTMVAAYRVVVQRWNADNALAELPKYGFHEIWWELRHFVRGLDSKTVRAKLDAMAAPELERVE